MESLRILMLEDSLEDAEVIQRLLKKEKPGCEFKLVMNGEDYIAALDSFEPHLVLSDNTLPQFNATAALEIFNERSVNIPFILVTGTVSEEFAVSIIQLGADDYILKDRLVRLPAAIDAALQKKKTANAIRHSEDMRKLIMNSSLDAIVCIDIAGVITMWNAQAEQMFGWKAAETIGKELATTIIPIRYREAHARGFNHYLKTGETKLLNKVVELTAINYYGDEFPVELAIVPLQQTGGDHFCAFIRNISARKKAEAAVRELEKQMLEQKIQEQKKISRAIIKAQEEEKNHIGKELHDNINQILVSTKIYLAVAAKKNESIKDIVKYPMELIDSSIEEIRLLSHKQVTPLKNIDLEELIGKLLFNLKQGTVQHLNFDYDVSGDFFSDDLKLNIYRILQEQINNIVKHADATTVAVSVKEEEKDIHIMVSDDGKGFDPENQRKGIGISNMMNRIESYNGTFAIQSAPGKGCTISVTMPANLLQDNWRDLS